VIESGHADQDAAYRIATFHALDGRTDQAIEWLERAISMGNENYPWFMSNPNWEHMRDEPKFKAIMEKLRIRWEVIKNKD
jgi:serine/threonine-protein kinase